MHYSTSSVVTVAALLAALPVEAGLYTKSSPVLQIDGKNYDRLIAQSNYTSIVEFYAPWCGHCKNLQPAYEKAAKSLAGLAKVAAVDCDEDSNKAFCGQFGVQGFPTLKIVKPGKTPGRPIVEDYQGGRTAKAIVDAVIDKIPNHIKKVDDATIDSWLSEKNETAKAVLFTDKGKTSALLKAVAIEFKGTISLAQIRNTEKEKKSLALLGVSKFPSLVLLPGGDAEAVVYDGEMKKEGMVAFLSQAALPNPDPAPAKVKLPKTKATKQTRSATEEILEDPTESPLPIVEAEKPIVLPPAAPIPILTTEADLKKECLGSKTGTCILVLTGSNPDELAAHAIGSLSEIAHKYRTQLKRHIFPFYVLPAQNDGHESFREALNLMDATVVVALNGKRGWWRALPTFHDQLSRDDISEEALESWIDDIRLGEGPRMTLPENLIVSETDEEEILEDSKPIPEPHIEL